MARWIGSLFAALFIALAQPVAWAADVFPNAPVHIVVPYAAGGASDILARLIGQRLGELWSQPVIVDNRVGAGGNIGTAYVAKSKADGYTLLLGDLSNFVIAPAVYKDLPYDVSKDFAGVTTLTYSPYLLLVTPGLPVRTMAELIAYARKNPGKLNWATTGLASAPHLAGLLFASSLGLDWVYVPNKGGAQANTDVIGGQADVMFNSMPASAGFVKQGQLRALAVTGSRRVADFPDLPLVSDAVPGFAAGGWQGVLAPAATPPSVVQKLNADIARVLQEPAIRARLEQLGAQPVGNSTGDMQRFVEAEKQRWADVVRKADLKL